VELTRPGKTKILISTRLKPADLEEPRTGSPLPGVRHIPLAGLYPNDAVAWLTDLGITGDPDMIKDYLAQFGYHSLLISVIGGKIYKNRRAGKNFERWLELEGRALKLNELGLVQRRTRILQYALDGLSDDASLVLQQIAAFRYPLDIETLFAVNPF